MGPRVLRVGEAVEERRLAHEPQRIADRRAHPLGRIVTLIKSGAAILPDLDRCARPARLERQAQGRQIGRRQHQAIRGNFRCDLRKLRMRALRDERAERIDRHPVAIPFEAGRAEAHAALCYAARRF